MTTTALEKELVKATKAKMRGDRQEALKGLVIAVNGLADEDWRRLSPDAQAWYNAASEAVDGEQEIDDFAEPEGTSESEEESSGSEADASEENADEHDAEAETAPARGKSKQKKEPAMAKKAKANGTAKPASATKAPTKAAKAAKEATPAKNAAKKPAPRPAARGGREEGEGGPTIIRRAVIKNPKITAKELTDILNKKSRKISPTTVSSVRAASVSMLKLLDEAGNLKGLKL